MLARSLACLSFTSLALAPSLLLAAPARAAESTLVDVGPGGPFSWETDAAVAEGDRVTLAEAALTSPRRVGGDLAVRLRGAWTEGAPTLTVDLGQGVRATVAPAAEGGRRTATLVGPAGEARAAVGQGPAFVLELVERGRWFQLFVDGLPGPAVSAALPLPAGVVRVAVEGGAATLDRATVVRLPWRDEVEVIGADAARLRRVEERPLSDFALLDPPPARVDPVYRIEVRGDPTPITVLQCGARRDAEEIPLLEQGLALAGVRPWLQPRLLEGPEGHESVVEGETPFGPFDVTDERLVFVCDALLGVGEEWPSLTLWELEKDRIIDRTVPGGPMGRGIECRVPDGVGRMKLVLSRPGRASIEHEIVLRRE